MKKIRYCRICNKELTKEQRRNKYCSEECRRIGANTPANDIRQIKCLECGKEFIPIKHDSRIRFCCKDCRLKYRNATGYMKRYAEINKDRLSEYNRRPDRKMIKNMNRNERYKTDAEFREKTKAKVKEYNKKHPEIKKNQRMKKYGLCYDDYLRMWDEQNGKCMICGAVGIKDDKIKTLYVDHDHTTGRVRGLLCHRCNFLIGQARDDVRILKSAIKYLSMNDKEIETMKKNQLTIEDYFSSLAT